MTHSDVDLIAVSLQERHWTIELSRIISSKINVQLSLFPTGKALRWVFIYTGGRWDRVWNSHLFALQLGRTHWLPFTMVTIKKNTLRLPGKYRTNVSKEEKCNFLLLSEGHFVPCFHLSFCLQPLVSSSFCQIPWCSSWSCSHEGFRFSLYWWFSSRGRHVVGSHFSVVTLLALSQ